jgi:hypothetical protein
VSICPPDELSWPAAEIAKTFLRENPDRALTQPHQESSDGTKLPPKC